MKRVGARCKICCADLSDRWRTFYSAHGASASSTRRPSPRLMAKRQSSLDVLAGSWAVLPFIKATRILSSWGRTTVEQGEFGDQLWRHEQKALVVMCDANILSVSRKTSRSTWLNAATRNDGQPLQLETD